MSAPRLMALGCLPCVGCAIMPQLAHDTYMGWPDIHCPGCYDDGSPYATAADIADAIDWWNERQSDRLHVPAKELCGYFWCADEHNHSEVSP